MRGFSDVSIDIHSNYGDPYNFIKSCKECGSDMSIHDEKDYCEHCREVEEFLED